MTEIIQTLRQSKGRCFIVGSVAGYFNLLGRLLNDVHFNVREDTVVLAGNFLGFSAASRQAPGWLKQPWVHAVLGENEIGVLSHLKDAEVRTLFGQWLSVIGERERDSMCTGLSSLPVALQWFGREDQEPAVISQLRLKPGCHWPAVREALNASESNSLALEAFESRIDTARALIARERPAPVTGAAVAISSMEVATPKRPVYRQANRAMLLGSIGIHHGSLYEADYKLAFAEISSILCTTKDQNPCGQHLELLGES